MAIDYINVDNSINAATHADQLIKYRNLIREARDQGKFILGIMNHLHDGSNFAAITTLFGLPSGAGQIVFDLVNGSIGAMEGTFQNADAKTLVERVGPGRNI